MATRRGTGRDARASRGRASLALVAVPVTVLLALSAFGENARGSKRGGGGRERDGGRDGSAATRARRAPLAMARNGDEGLGRARARAVDYDKVLRERKGSTTTTTTTTSEGGRGGRRRGGTRWCSTRGARGVARTCSRSSARGEG